MNRYIALQKIIETGSFTKTAEALGYTQSAMSIISSIACAWMPQLIKGFLELYPNVQFIFHQGDYTSIQEWIKTGVVDFGFVTPPAVTELETITIKDGEILAVLPQGHPLASNCNIRLEEIAGEPFILLGEGHYSEPMEAFRAAGLEPNIKYTIHDGYVIMTMVEAGLGIGILAELMLRRANYNIVCLPVEPRIFRTIAVGYKDKNSLPIASKYFTEYLIANANKLP